ncbi:hypothetical protein D3C72_1193420 [compost metagenome]
MIVNTVNENPNPSPYNAFHIINRYWGVSSVTNAIPPAPINTNKSPMNEVMREPCLTIQRPPITDPMSQEKDMGASSRPD